MAERLAPLGYYKWHWQSWRANRKVQRMSYIERGIYRELLDECWAEGFIPDDVEKLADICGCPSEVMANAWQVLSKCFANAGNGFLYNERLEQERTDTDRTRANRARAGAAGGRAKATNGAGSDGNSLANASKCQANASNSHIEEKRREEKRRESEESDAEFRIDLSWRPSDDANELIKVGRGKLPSTESLKSHLANFIGYWRTRDSARRQAQWDNAFADWVVKKEAEEQRKNLRPEEIYINVLGQQIDTADIGWIEVWKKDNDQHTPERFRIDWATTRAARKQVAA